MKIASGKHHSHKVEETGDETGDDVGVREDRQTEGSSFGKAPDPPCGFEGLKGDDVGLRGEKKGDDVGLREERKTSSSYVRRGETDCDARNKFANNTSRSSPSFASVRANESERERRTASFLEGDGCNAQTCLAALSKGRT
eukprot:354903-Chlamydomonas_euryale.AAC.16